MNTFGVVSDDLTSALESTGAFAARGIESCVALNVESMAKLLSVPCVAIDAATRVMNKNAARRRITAAVKAIGDRGLIVKTMDSTLRGHVSMEIETALAASNRHVAIVAPAFPSEGRTTVGGCQYVDGMLVEETAFRHDPDWPITQSDICEILRHGVFDVVQSIGDLATANLAALIEEAHDGRLRTALVIDATTQAQLEHLCSLVTKLDQVIWVGSPGLLVALANRFSIDAQPMSVPTVESTSPVIVAVGSVNPVSRRQLTNLQERKGTAVVTIDPALALEDPQRAAEKAIDELTNNEHANEIIAVTTTLDVSKLSSQRTENSSDTEVGEIGKALTQAIGAAVVDLSKRFDSACYVLTGGDTALEVSRQLGAHGFNVVGMMEIGIPVATLIGATGVVITKAGGFGDREWLIRACDYMQQTVQKRRDLD